MASEAFKAFLQAALAAPDYTAIPVEQNRLQFDAEFAAVPLPDGVVCKAIDSDGVPGEWVVPPVKPERVILYFHGGGFRAGSRVVGRPVAAQLAVQARALVLNAEYRLAPEDPFPAAVEDAVAAYRWLSRMGVGAHVAIVGESAGANLAIAVLLVERDFGHRLPASAYLISPAPDMSPSWDVATTNSWRDPFISPRAVDLVVADYCPTPGHVLHPWVSPVFAELSGLPPLYVQAGEREPFRDAIRRFVHKARRSGVDVTLEEGEEMFHCWPVMVGAFPEADESLARGAAFLRSHTPAGSISSP